MIQAQAPLHQVALAAGLSDGGTPPLPCPVTLVGGLEARTRQPTELDRLLASFAPDVVHVHTVMNPTVLEWARQRRAVITIQDHRYFCPARGKWTAEGLPCHEAMRKDLCAACFDDGGYFEEIYAVTAERLASLQGMRVIVLSEYMKAELIAAGLSPGDLSVVPPFVHGLDASARADGPACVLFVGRLTAAKGVRDAVAAWRQSKVSLPLAFAGTGPLRDEMEREGFEVLGWVAHDRMSSVYRRARALLMPSRWQEPFGIAGLEALSLGVPVAAWDSGGVREWLKDGLVPWGDVAGLAQALRDAVERHAAAPPGYDEAVLMRRLYDAYRGERPASLSST